MEDLRRRVSLGLGENQVGHSSAGMCYLATREKCVAPSKPQRYAKHFEAGYDVRIRQPELYLHCSSSRSSSSSHVLSGEESKRPPICRTGLRSSFWREVLQHAVHPGRTSGRKVFPPEQQLGSLEAAEAYGDQRGVGFTRLTRVNFALYLAVHIYHLLIQSVRKYMERFKC